MTNLLTGTMDLCEQGITKSPTYFSLDVPVCQEFRY